MSKLPLTLKTVTPLEPLTEEVLLKRIALIL
jgi:hypothetical protein